LGIREALSNGTICKRQPRLRSVSTSEDPTDCRCVVSIGTRCIGSVVYSVSSSVGTSAEITGSLALCVYWLLGGTVLCLLYSSSILAATSLRSHQSRISNSVCPYECMFTLLPFVVRRCHQSPGAFVHLHGASAKVSVLGVAARSSLVAPTPCSCWAAFMLRCQCDHQRHQFCILRHYS
jgi:hypothetical protein